MRENYLDWIRDKIGARLIELSDTDLASFINAVADVVLTLRVKYEPDGWDKILQRRKLWPAFNAENPVDAPQTDRKNKALHNVSESDKHARVKAQLPSLLERLKDATAQRGKRSILAKRLGVPLSSVSQWLSGDREPGGETTLRLLDWVQAEETKQKGPGHARTRPERKTRKRKSSNEKPKSSPQ